MRNRSNSLRIQTYIAFLVAVALLCVVSADPPGVLGWRPLGFVLLPVVYIIYRYYRRYLDHLEAEKTHIEEMAALHLRTIEALALAIEAKDRTTHAHLSRVRAYAVQIGEAMGLSGAEMEALRAASLLHDIGKLAVPEHIVCKPGRLTPEEFEVMKIHPVVGAEILQRVEFPYPVAEIVRAHHEKWDGSGYPNGVRGEDIPIGARILAVVDCLDALTSDRHYRPALPLELAMAELSRLSGTAFDPTVVDTLQQVYTDLDSGDRSTPPRKLCTDVKVERGEAPAAGFELSGPVPEHGGTECEFQSSAASREVEELLHDMARDLSNSLLLEEILSAVADRLRRLVPYDAIAVYVARQGRLVPEFVDGERSRSLSFLDIPIGQGLSGWVARTGRPVLNGNPAVEAAWPATSPDLAALHSAAAVPLMGYRGPVGVLTLYRTEPDAFSRDHIQLLLAATSKASPAIDNALRFRRADSATTDYITDLPNARALLPRLESELARSRRTNEPLTVLVCDLVGFRQINDRYGHVAGNKVLRAVAAALRECCREYDYVARIGGDEFVLILPASDRDAMGRRIAELREIGARAGRKSAGIEQLTMRIGQAFFPHDGDRPEQLLAEAERRMEQSRQGDGVAVA